MQQIGTRAPAPPYLDECAILQQTKKALQWSARWWRKQRYSRMHHFPSTMPIKAQSLARQPSLGGARKMSKPCSVQSPLHQIGKSPKSCHAIRNKPPSYRIQSDLPFCRFPYGSLKYHLTTYKSNKITVSCISYTLSVQRIIVVLGLQQGWSRPPAHHPLETVYDSVVDDPQLRHIVRFHHGNLSSKRNCPVGR